MNIENNDQVVYLYLDDIIPNRFQPREVFDEKALKELAVSIKEHGVIQPIIVRNVKGKYEIIAGERRYKASALAGLTKIPAIVRELDDKESSKVALLENLQRKNLTPIEEARTYQKILEIDEMTQEDLAKTMGKSQSAVANKLRLLSLPDEVQDSLLKEQISERHARALLNVPNSKKQKEMLKKIISNKMSVRTLEDEIKQLYPKNENDEGFGMTNNQNIGISSSEVIPSTSNFINNSPLMPTTTLPETEKGYGGIKIVPPEGEELPQKFINYGEIGKEKEDDEPPMQFNNPNPTIDLNSIREKSLDINVPLTNTNSPSADLDGLLNLQNMAAGPGVGNIPGTSKFLSPAEEIVKTDAIKPIIQEKTEDYFKAADFIPNIPTPGIKDIEENKQGPYNIDDAMKKIRELVTELKNNGISISSDEMNFENSFQVIIKIEK